MKRLITCLLLLLVVGCAKSEQAREQPVSSEDFLSPVIQSKPPPHQAVAEHIKSDISGGLADISEELSSMYHGLSVGTKAFSFGGVKPLKTVSAAKDVQRCWDEVFISPARAVAAAEQAATWEAIARLAGHLFGMSISGTTYSEDGKEIGGDFLQLTDNTITWLAPYDVKTIRDEGGRSVYVMILVGQTLRHTLPPIHVKKLESFTFETKTDRNQLWINDVLVIDEELIEYPNGKVSLRYRQWYSHGSKWIDVTMDEGGTVGRNWRESGIVEQKTQ